MARYRVTYRTPAVDRGEAHVSASGLHPAQDEARTAVHILTGHPPEDILILAVTAHPSGPTLWWDPALYTPSADELSPWDRGARPEGRHAEGARPDGC